jgi:hypothetical protein
MRWYKSLEFLCAKPRAQPLAHFVLLVVAWASLCLSLVFVFYTFRVLWNEYDDTTDIYHQVDQLANVYPMEGQGMVTAVLLNWARLENLRLILVHLCKYTMFKEIVLWNNNPDSVINTKVMSPSVRWTRCGWTCSVSSCHSGINADRLAVVGLSGSQFLSTHTNLQLSRESQVCCAVHGVCHGHRSVLLFPG